LGDGNSHGSATFYAYDTLVYFTEHSTAANATFDCGIGGGSFFFSGTSAGNAVFILNGGSGHGYVSFDGGDASSASFTAESGTVLGGLVYFGADSTGGTCSVELLGDGSGTVDLRDGHLDISEHDAPGISIGSLEGSGLVLLGANNLTVGTNNLSTTFSGIVQDTGSLTKIGSGNLTLTNANAYTGGTVLESGVLLVNNTGGSGTGSGPVQVQGGTLGGAGTIGGAVVVGIGSGAGAVLGPGERGILPGTLTIQRNLTLKADATYVVLFDSSTPAADQVKSKGVAIRRAKIEFGDRSMTVLAPGTVFTVIDNTSRRPIRGEFINLADAGTVSIGSNTFQADYQGGDGNDLTLTVVP
jgi:autotransporter-associated beta strand protein